MRPAVALQVSRRDAVLAIRAHRGIAIALVGISAGDNGEDSSSGSKERGEDTSHLLIKRVVVVCCLVGSCE